MQNFYQCWTIKKKKDGFFSVIVVTLSQSMAWRQHYGISFKSLQARQLCFAVPGSDERPDTSVYLCQFIQVTLAFLIALRTAWKKRRTLFEVSG